jgi:hypothetical protein
MSVEHPLDRISRFIPAGLLLFKITRLSPLGPLAKGDRVHHLPSRTCAAKRHGRKRVASQIGQGRLREALLRYSVDGRPLFDISNPLYRQRLDKIMAEVDLNSPIPTERGMRMETCDSIMARTKDLDIFTDDNMGEEWMGEEWVLRELNYPPVLALRRRMDF